MVIGDPYKFGFLIERVDSWEYEPFINGLMFLFLNEQGYPDELRTTTLSAELPELFDKGSPFMSPAVDKEFFYMECEERFERLAALTYPESIDKESDLSYVLPFHEINDAGYAVFVLSDGSDVLISVGQWSEGKLLPLDERIVPSDEYKSIVRGLKSFYEREVLRKKPDAAHNKVTVKRVKRK